jgi:hypothetical protein
LGQQRLDPVQRGDEGDWKDYGKSPKYTNHGKEQLWQQTLLSTKDTATVVAQTGWAWYELNWKSACRFFPYLEDYTMKRTIPGEEPEVLQLTKKWDHHLKAILDDAHNSANFMGYYPEAVFFNIIARARAKLNGLELNENGVTTLPDAELKEIARMIAFVQKPPTSLATPEQTKGTMKFPVVRIMHKDDFAFQRFTRQQFQSDTTERLPIATMGTSVPHGHERFPLNQHRDLVCT